MVGADASPTPVPIEERDRSPTPGLGALAASEEAYRGVRRGLESQGVRFLGMPAALARLPDLVRSHFASVVATDDHPLASLNSALWTGGSFLYVPPDVRVEVPLQAEI